MPLLAILIAVSSGAASGHGGGLNSEGCHNNRRTGDYHCHRPGAVAKPALQRIAPARPNRLSSEDAGARPFRNCAEARAAGAAPVRRGDPGYGSHLDRDNDGIGCE
jgi:hypothetical protein